MTGSADGQVTLRRLALTHVEVSVAEAGAGGRPLLLAHGFTGAKEDFTPWLAALAARGWHAVAPDHRGHGESEQPPLEAQYTLGLAASDLLDLADELGWGRFVLLGHSMGGAIAQRLAFAAPERLAGLVLMATFHGPLPLPADVVELAVDVVRSSGTAGYLAGLQALAAAAGPTAESSAAADDSAAPARPDAALRAADPSYAAWQDAKVLATGDAAFVGFLRGMRREQDRLGDLAARVRSAGVPVQVLVGEHDAALVPHARRLAAAFGVPAEVLPGGGHSPQFEATHAWWTALTTFLDRVAAAGG